MGARKRYASELQRCREVTREQRAQLQKQQDNYEQLFEVCLSMMDIAEQYDSIADRLANLINSPKVF